MSPRRHAVLRLLGLVTAGVAGAAGTWAANSEISSQTLLFPALVLITSSLYRLDRADAVRRVSTILVASIFAAGLAAGAVALAASAGWLSRVSVDAQGATVTMGILFLGRIGVDRAAALVPGRSVHVLGRGPRSRAIADAVQAFTASGLRLTDSADADIVVAPKPSDMESSVNIPAEFGRTEIRTELGHGTRLVWREGPGDGTSHAVKRTMDLALALPAFAVALAPMALLGVVVMLHSRGPAFHVQTRLTRAGRRFSIFKLRSMRADAEALGKPVWPSHADDRITRLGHLLRRYWLDELPQLLNVLKGDLSLVGPRPERPRFAQVFTEGLTRYHQRHRAVAGLTGWAQVNGFVGNTSIRKRLHLDLDYIERWSPGFDVCVMTLTLCRIVKRTPRKQFDFVPGRDAWIP